MRFALMIEPQQGLTYAEQLAIVQRAEAVGLRVVLPVGPLPELPGAVRRADDRRLGGPRRARPRDDDDHARHARLAGHVPAGRQPRQGRHDGRRDERRPGRVRARRRLERAASIASSGCRSRPIKERADMLEEQFAVLHGLWGEPDGWSFDGQARPIEDAQFHPKPVARPGRPTLAERRRPAAAAGRRRGLAALVPDRRPLRRRVQPVVVLAGDGARRSSRSSSGVRGDRPGSGDDGPVGRWPAC